MLLSNLSPEQVAELEVAERVLSHLAGYYQRQPGELSAHAELVRYDRFWRAYQELQDFKRERGIT